jgi:hypothetical protein
MLADLANWAFTNPWGITVTGTIAAAGLIAIAARVIRPFGALLSRIPRLRVTTAAREKTPLPPARWMLRPTRSEGSWVLINHGAGNATSVQLDPADGASEVYGAGFWKSIPGHHAVGVKVRLDNTLAWRDESTFRVTWFDKRKIRHGIDLEAYPRERYNELSSVPDLPTGQLLPVPPPQ